MRILELLLILCLGGESCLTNLRSHTDWSLEPTSAGLMLLAKLPFVHPLCILLSSIVITSFTKIDSRRNILPASSSYHRFLNLSTIFLRDVT